MVIVLPSLSYFRLGYRFYRSSTYYELGRNIYEGIALCSFLILVCEFLATTDVDMSNKKRQKLVIPLCCFPVNPGQPVSPFVFLD